jgi:hypothetical protein
MFDEIFLGIKKIEKTINETVKERIEESWGDLQVIKIDFEDLVADFILDLLDVAAISDYVTCMDVEGGKLLLEINSNRVQMERNEEKRRNEKEQEELIREYWNSRGVY